MFLTTIYLLMLQNSKPTAGAVCSSTPVVSSSIKKSTQWAANTTGSCYAVRDSHHSYWWVRQRWLVVTLLRDFHAVFGAKCSGDVSIGVCFARCTFGVERCARVFVL